MPLSRKSGSTTRRSGPSAPSRPYSSAAAPSASTATHHHAPPAHHAPAPAPHHAPAAAPAAHAPATAQAPAQSGGLLSGLAGTVMSGMAFGTGSAVAHRAVDSIMGPRQVEHVHKDDANTPSSTMQAIDSTSSSAARAGNFACGDETQQFQSCLTQNNGNLSSCQFFFDVLTQCKQNLKQ